MAKCFRVHGLSFSVQLRYGFVGIHRTSKIHSARSDMKSFNEVFRLYCAPSIHTQQNEGEDQKDFCGVWSLLIHFGVYMETSV